MPTGMKFVQVNNLHDLPTYQKRLRHLRCLAVRNLSCGSYHGKETTRMQTYFTLHKDNFTKAFYTSEKITGSVNPTWKSFNISQYEKDIDTKSTFIVLRIWVGEDVAFKLLIELQVHLTGLVFFAEKLQQGGVKYTPNTVIFGMFDKYFIAPELPNQGQATALQKLKTEEDLNPPKNSFVLKCDQCAVRNSYSTSSLSRIHTILKATKQTQASVNRVHCSIEDCLLSSQEITQKLREREQLLMKVGQLRQELRWQSMKRQCESDTVGRIHASNNKRENTLKEEEKTLEKSRKSLDEHRKSYVDIRETLVKVNAQLVMRRKQLVGEMASYIYPITENSKKRFFICGVRLPNSEEFQGCDETTIAVALGSTCHMTMMISQFLDFPLRYTMEARGSRALIKDHIHVKLTDKDREFPLYSKGKEKFQFNYGVFLLNKNISQIRFYAGLGTTDLRMTLPNLKTLLELRLGVKTDFPLPWTLTPTSGTGKSIGTSTAMESTRSTAGSSSTNSPTPKCDITRVPSIDQGISETTGHTYSSTKSDNLQVPNNGKDHRLQLQDNEDIFLASDDDFFRIRNSISNTGINDELSTLSAYQLKELTSADSLEVLDDRLALLSEGRLNDLEAVKATLQIHFDNNGDGGSGSSARTSSCSNGDDISSGEDKHHSKNDGETLNGEVQGEGQTLNGEVQGEGQTLSGEIQGEGQTLSGEVHGEGQTLSGEIQGEGQTLSEEGQTVSADVQGESHTLSGKVQGEGQTLSAEVQGEGRTLSDEVQGEGRTLSDEVQGEGRTLNQSPSEFECDFPSESSLRHTGDQTSCVTENVDKASDINGCLTSTTFKTSAFHGHRGRRDLSPDNSSQSSISDDYTLTAEVVS
ncbi:UV radiation resistance-associated protein-like [Gigantopelta aegis]|uniref:UV radiation resistance-associated protein-like n=1 Tax=Gigantopelta aegis TaxID=1735272 RepID=UPI001B88BC4A|nr:UV radiation resistance-associated protein-like [Gigantopelta aegis]